VALEECTALFKVSKHKMEYMNSMGPDWGRLPQWVHQRAPSVKSWIRHRRVMLKNTDNADTGN